LQKMARENFNIGAFYNITKNQDNPIKTVGRSFEPQNPKKYKFLGLDPDIQHMSKFDRNRIKRG